MARVRKVAETRPFRPQVKIDWKLVDKLLEKGCEGPHVAERIGISQHTLYRRAMEEKHMLWSEYKQLKRTRGDSFLIEKQYDLALEGDRVLLIYLGKTRLGQIEAKHKDDNSEQMGQLLKFIQNLAQSNPDSIPPPEKAPDELPPES